MVKADDIFPETPTLTDIKWPVWINPKVKERIEQKFHGRVMITVATYLAAIADDSIVLITGEQAKKLRDHGIKNGAEMVALAESVKQLEKEKDEAIQQILRFQDILKQAGVA